MKTIVIKDELNANVVTDFLTDLIDGNESFTVYQINGGRYTAADGTDTHLVYRGIMHTDAIAVGLDQLGDGIQNLNTWAAYCQTNALSLEIYEEGQDVIIYVYYGGAIGGEVL